MTLGFSTKFKDGTPTYFPQKVWCGLIDHDKKIAKQFNTYYNQSPEMKQLDNNISLSFTPKLHSMREDAHDKWHAGNDIHFVINNRTKDRFQFAPVIPCVSVQKIYMQRYYPVPIIYIDGKPIYDIEVLAKNDGFYNADDFLNWFLPHENDIWKGKIIHWTDLKY